MGDGKLTLQKLLVEMETIVVKLLPLVNAMYVAC